MPTDPNQRLLLGTRKGLFILRPDNAASSGWSVATVAHLGIPVSYATVDPRSGTMWACLDHGHWGQKLQRSKDWGETWEELESPKYPEGSILREDTPATMQYLWVFEPGPADQPNRLYIGTEPGGLFMSDNGGDSFSLVDSLWNHHSRVEQKWFGGGRDEAGIHSVVIDPRDSNRIFIGVSCSGVFESTDGGRTWDGRNKGLNAEFLPDPQAEYGHDPHLLVQCRNHPDVLWQQNHCGIFRSEDAGANWTEISESNGGPAKFGFVISADPDNPDVAWVVPAKADECRVAIDGALCVSRTDDGGKTWKALRNGLPQEHCYDIVFRLAMDLHNDTLAFGTTTGNVYASDDRGDSWRSLGHHFPLVYSVRFATA